VAAPFFKGRHTGSEAEITGMIILAAIFLLPAIFPEKIGWLATLIPLPVFYYLTRLGNKKGLILIRNAVFLATQRSISCRRRGTVTRFSAETVFLLINGAAGDSFLLRGF
jgi:hypothetical protein